MRRPSRGGSRSLRASFPGGEQRPRRTPVGGRGLFARMALPSVRPQALVPRGPRGELNPAHVWVCQEQRPRRRTRSDDVLTG